MAEERQAPLVGPLEVVEDQDDELVPERAANSPTTAAKNRNRSVSASVAFDGGRSGRRLARAGHQPGQLGSVGLDMGQQLSSGAWVT